MKQKKRHVKIVFISTLTLATLQLHASNIESAHYILEKSTVVADFGKIDPTDSAAVAELLGQGSMLHSSEIAKSFLNVPGFSMGRKGGGGSEAFFRSQGASRLPIYLDGGILNGGCGGRMDTPLTYIFPESYDQVSIIKGPQDVRYGGLMAGGILFERRIQRASAPTLTGDASVLYGSFSRLDMTANVAARGQYGGLQILASDYSQEDYRAANKKHVHSQYDRQSLSIIGTLTPTQTTAIELAFDVSQGEAAYADRSMDGKAFDRQSWNLHVQQEISKNVPMVELLLWRNQIDHIMDNYSLRPASMMFMASNPKRTNHGVRAEVVLQPTTPLRFYTGVSYNNDKHVSRSASANNANAATDMLNANVYVPNYLLEDIGIYTQAEFISDSGYGLFGGVRYDNSRALQYATGTKAIEGLGSAFARYEHYLQYTTLFVGAGLAQRAPDFWERNKLNGMALSKEQNAQLDIGLHSQYGKWNLQASAFASFVKNYILLHYTTQTTALNTDATLYGGEFEVGYQLFEPLRLSAGLAYTYGQSNTLHSPLPQIAPLSSKVGLNFVYYSWIAQVDIFANAAQHRFKTDYGNIIGKDIGKTAGFYTLNAYTGYAHKYFTALVGVENATNQLYAYHLSKNSIAIDGLQNPTSTRVYEPGAQFWFKLQARF